MPEELALISIVAIIAGAITIMSIARAIVKTVGKRSAADSSLTTSQLQALMQAAVEEATRPLLAKIERLEDRLDARVPLNGRAREPLALPADAESEAAPEREPRRSATSAR